MVRQLKLELKERERKELERERDHHRQPQVRERCAALLKIADGHSAHKVAQHGLLKTRDPDTVYGWLRLYEKEGLNGLVKSLHGGDHRSSRRVKKR